PVLANTRTAGDISRIPESDIDRILEQNVQTPAAASARCASSPEDDGAGDGTGDVFPGFSPVNSHYGGNQRARGGQGDGTAGSLTAMACPGGTGPSGTARAGPGASSPSGTGLSRAAMRGAGRPARSGTGAGRPGAAAVPARGPGEPSGARPSGARPGRGPLAASGTGPESGPGPAAGSGSILATAWR